MGKEMKTASPVVFQVRNRDPKGHILPIMDISKFVLHRATHQSRPRPVNTKTESLNGQQNVVSGGSDSKSGVSAR